MSMRYGRLLLPLLVFAACERSSTEPEQAGGDRMTFALNGTTRSLAGAPAGSAALLSRSFVVARADSVGGIVAIGYEATGENAGNLLVLQAPRAVGTYTCADGEPATPCHGRYIVGMREGSSTFTRYYGVTSGTLTLTQIGPDRLRGTFTLMLRADDDGPDGTIELRDGTMDVPYVGDPGLDGALGCLLSRVDIGNGTCGGT